MSRLNSGFPTFATTTGYVARSIASNTLTVAIGGEDMADGSFLDFLNMIQGLLQGLGSSQSKDDVPLVGDTQAPTPGFGRQGYRCGEKKDHLKGKIGDMTLEAYGNDAPGMLQSEANTLTNAYARRKGVDFLFKTLEMQRDKEFG
jgi:hypothetical protein